MKKLLEKKSVLYVLLAIGLCFLTGCAAGPNTVAHTVNHAGEIAGFWSGIWHGLIVPATFVISLFTDSVQIYEVHNNGPWYNFGFIAGLILIYDLIF